MEVSPNLAAAGEVTTGSHPTTYGERLNDFPELKQKLVLHRGWHRIENHDETRPLENTRQAYVQAARTGCAYAECDVWPTSDGVIVLAHNKTFQSLAKHPDSRVATTLIKDLSWNEVQNLELLDGSTPVTLETVLKDLKETGTKLAIELKHPDPARPLARMLCSNLDLVDAVGFVMGFHIDSVAEFSSELKSLSTELASKLHVLWLSNNPRENYGQNLSFGETTFNPTESELVEYLRSKGFLEKFSQNATGMYLQYNPRVDEQTLKSLRKSLQTLLGRTDVFLGMWSDRVLDPKFDTLTLLNGYTDTLDGINTDVPAHFF